MRSAVATSGALARAVACVLAAAALVVLAGVGTAGAWGDVRSPGPATLGELCGLVAACACTAVTCWLGVAVGLCVADTVWRSVLRRRGALTRITRRVAPAALRNVVAVLVTAAVLVPTAAQAAGRPTSTAVRVVATAPARVAPQGDPLAPTWLAEPVAPAATGSAAEALSPRWLPDAVHVRRTVTAVAMPAVALRARATVQAEVVVCRGDTLWDIAARHLGPGASDAAVLDAWPDWYAANRDVIGDDPAVIRPGQRLHPPTG